MSKELPYFKFEPAEWLAGDVTICSTSTQGLFINLMCLYWIKNCELNLAIAKHKFPNCQNEFAELEKFEIIKIENEKIKISFLDLQFSERSAISKKLSKNGALGGIAKARQTSSKCLANANIREEKRREEKREEKNRGNKITEEEYTSFLELFNSIPELPKVSTLSETRKKKLKLRWSEGLKNEYSNVIEKIKASDFLLGKVTGKDGRTWKATFDWLIENDTNWIKIIEGKYNQGESAPTEPKKTKEELTKTLNFYLRQGYDYEYIARNMPFLKEVIPCK